MSQGKILVFLGSVREGRLGERVAKLAIESLKKHGLDPDLIDPLNFPSLLSISQPLHFRKDPSAAPKEMIELNERIIKAEGFVLVSAEYNCNLPPALLSILDQFPPASYKHRPCGAICYSMGVLGGARAAVLCRSLITELGLCPVPFVPLLPKVNTTVDENGVTLEDDVTSRIDRFSKELSWYVEALKTQKDKAGYP